jgi:hypothetical protein
MSFSEKKDWFDDVESVVAEPFKFKTKLAIGEEAYATLRLKNAVVKIWDVAGAAGTGGAIAASAPVAATFFAPSGLLAIIGIGTAVTPIGWVVAAAVLSGTSWVGITHYTKKFSSGRVTVIPDFINTPIDILGLGLFDLIAPLALKVAEIDGHIDEKERELIITYFVNEWGYDLNFVNTGVAFTESKLSEFKIKELAKMLAEFQKSNPDCNYKPMTEEIITFLKGIMEVDGIIDEREEMAIEKIQAIFEETDRIEFKKMALNSIGTIKSGAGKVINKFKPN